MGLSRFESLPSIDRDLLAAAWEQEQGACATCGDTSGSCSDPEVVWYPQRSVCYRTMAQVSAQRRYDTKHEKLPYHNGAFRHWMSKPTEATPFKYDDGVQVWVSSSNLTPDDDFI